VSEKGFCRREPLGARSLQETRRRADAEMRCAQFLQLDEARLRVGLPNAVYLGQGCSGDILRECPMLQAADVQHKSSAQFNKTAAGASHDDASGPKYTAVPSGSVVPGLPGWRGGGDSPYPSWMIECCNPCYKAYRLIGDGDTSAPAAALPRLGRLRAPVRG
jgi:hypothetical protein